jgi:hypothetical protein
MVNIMKKYLSIFVLFLLGFIHLHGQGDLRDNSSKSAKKISFATGFTYDFIPIFYEDNVTPVFSDGTLAQYGVAFKGIYVLAHSNDVVSINGAAGLHFDFLFSTLGFGTFLRVPFYALARLGSQATPFNNQSFGIGVGAGLAANYLLQPYTDASNRLDKISQFYLAPTILAEINWRYAANTGLQFYFNPINARGYLSATAVNPIPIRIGGIGIGIYYSF